ncbi:hypothetical protein AB0I77_14600 [Streptomyces sp. NPDC050619]
MASASPAPAGPRLGHKARTTGLASGLLDRSADPAAQRLAIR